MKRFLFSFAMGLLFVTAPARAAGDPFPTGVQAYLSGDFTRASSSFSQAANAAPSAGAFHNLGNAEWYCGHPGPAILAWERALGLEPYNKNTRAN